MRNNVNRQEYSLKQLDGPWMEDGGMWVKVERGRATSYLENPFTNPETKGDVGGEEVQAGVEDGNIPDGWYIVITDDGFSILPRNIHCKYVTVYNSFWEYAYYWIPLYIDRKGGFNKN